MPPDQAILPAPYPPAIDAGIVGSAWTMPTFYLAPFMGAYILAAGAVVRGLSILRPTTARPRRRGYREHNRG